MALEGPPTSETELPRKLATQTVPAPSTAIPWGRYTPPPVTAPSTSVPQLFTSLMLLP